MKRLLRSAAALLCALFFAGAALAKLQVATLIVLPQDLRQNPQIVTDLQRGGINHATVYLTWADVEAQPGQFDFSSYEPYFDQLTQGGLSLIVVLDMGGRIYFDAMGKQFPGRTTVPDWLYKQVPEGIMKNFSGEFTPQPDFMNPAVRKYSARFVRNAVAHLAQRYPGKITAYAIGLQEEHEIKYGQTGYQWRDYAGAAQAAFRQQTGAPLPVINYTNDIALGLPRTEPLLHTHKQFREARLKDATCFYADAIRSQGGRAMSYFGELFTTHDAIYATSVVEQLADCLDIAVIDYNFFDGYSLSPDARVLPMLANYMASVGYKQIMVGAYAEQWERVKKSADLLPVISRTLSASLAQANVIGYEVGGLQRQFDPHLAGTLDLAKLQALRVQPRTPATANTAQKLSVGILASTSNYYVWHGDRSGGVNVHREALLETFNLLSNQPGMEVHVIGEKNLQEGDPLLQRLNAIMVPHQAALPAAVKQRLTAYWNKGGTLIQDMRLGEFDENGKPVFDWMHEVFGIEHITWKPRGGIFTTADGQILRLRSARKLYTGYAAMIPRPGFRLLATDLLNKRQGIMVRGERTLAFGFTPQLVDDATQAMWQQIFVREITNAMLCPTPTTCRTPAPRL
ncbi:MAG: beta-galactosidase [Proteobacteria bacterium]|nr:beta-galactosidase [Pseudomonadota bacterium]